MNIKIIHLSLKTYTIITQMLIKQTYTNITQILMT